MSLESDALLGATGLFPKGIGDKEHLAALALPDKVAKRLRAWVLRDEPVPMAFHPPPEDMDALFDKLAASPSESEVDGWLAALGVDGTLGTDYFVGLTRARQLVVDAWPKFYTTGPAGPRVLPLSPDDIGDVWALVQVLEDPLRLVDEMGALTLEPAQARVFREAYPDLYQAADDAIKDAEAERLAKQPGWEYGWERASVLNILRGVAPEEIRPPPPAPAPAPAKLKLDPERDRTQAEVSSAPKGG